MCPLRDEKEGSIGETNLIQAKADNKGEESHYIEGAVINEDPVERDNEIVVSYCYHLEGMDEHGDSSILLDTGSTISVFKNEKLLTNVRNVSQTMRAITNGGHQDSTRKGILPKFFPVWVNPRSRMNILSWKDVRKKYRITADTAESKSITVHINDDKKMLFSKV